MISNEPKVYRYIKLILFALLEGPSIFVSIYKLLHRHQYRSRLNKFYAKDPFKLTVGRECRSTCKESFMQKRNYSTS